MTVSSTCLKVMLFPLPSKEKKKAGFFQVKLLKFPTQGTARGRCWCWLSGMKKEIPSLLPEDWASLLSWGQETPVFMMFCLPAKHLKSFVCSTVRQTWISIRKKKKNNNKTPTRDQPFLVLNEWKNTWVLMCSKPSSQNTEGNGQYIPQISPWRLQKTIPPPYLPSRALIYDSPE